MQTDKFDGKSVWGYGLQAGCAFVFALPPERDQKQDKINEEENKKDK